MAISRMDAFPSDHVECMWRSPRMSSRVNSGGGSPRNGCSRNSGGHQGIPSCAYRDSSSGAGGNSPRPPTYACVPVATTNSVPKRAGSATTSSTGTPSTVTPTARRSLRSSTETIAGSASNASSTGRGRAAEDAAEPDELRLYFTLELVELGDAAGLDELAQARCDPRADPTQLLYAPCSNELGDRGLRLADRLGRSSIGARGVEARAGEIEERRETLQLLGDPRVVEGIRHGLVSLAP